MRSVVPTHNSYISFDRVVRTVHLAEALDVCVRQRMEPKFIYSLCSINRKILRRDHPCKNLQVLWFGGKHPDYDEDEPDWYGNVEFAIHVDFLLKKWNYCFLVDMMSAPTHSVTRLLITNTDYSRVLPKYDPTEPGGPWHITPKSHELLTDCLRYNNKGNNIHGHTLEFMIEATPFGQEKLLENCEISFRNHSEAEDMSRTHVCHRFRNTNVPCPSPVKSSMASRIFFHEHARLRQHSLLAAPRLSHSAEYFRRCYLTMDGAPSIPRRNLVPMPDPLLHGTLPMHPPGFYMNNQFSKFFLQFPGGLLLGHQIFQRSCAGMGPESMRQMVDMRFYPWAHLLEHLWKQRLRGEEEAEGEDPGGHLQLAESQDQQDQSDVVGTRGHSQSGMLPNNSGHPEMFQHNPWLFQSSWSPAYPGMPPNFGDLSQPTMFLHSWG
ncbi:hypothetical protein Hamer_G022447 [Homarus americanus]|uniref:Uncharacterized protein n=1 Tax=Homarus americanus TaxID=6706 RepID=A0A8J5N854_HOMAM|nr:hypothetical protein Hamer_G022447 [Homarus americanus]